jgi:hypothetical protein
MTALAAGSLYKKSVLFFMKSTGFECFRGVVFTKELWRMTFFDCRKTQKKWPENSCRKLEQWKNPGALGKSLIE